MSARRAPRPQHRTQKACRHDRQLENLFIFSVGVIFLKLLWVFFFIPVRSAGSQRKHRIPISTLRTEVFIVRVDNYYWWNMTNAMSSNTTGSSKMNDYSLYFEQIIRTIRKSLGWVSSIKRTIWMFCWQRLPRCRKFALCPLDFYSGDTLVRGVMQQAARQRDRWKGRLRPLYEGLSPILSLWQELIRVWEERLRRPLTHTYAHIIHSKRDINPSFRARDSAKGNRFLSHTSQARVHTLTHTHTLTRSHTPAAAFALQRAHMASAFKGPFWQTVQFHLFIWSPLGCCYRCVQTYYCVWIASVSPAETRNLDVPLERRHQHICHAHC